MPKVFDRFNLPSCECTPSGDEFEVINEIEIDPETGIQRLVPTGELRPIQACINAALGSNVLDLDEAFRRYVNGEDVKLIVRPASVYADVSEFSGDSLDTFIKVRDQVGNIIVKPEISVSDVKEEKGSDE